MNKLASGLLSLGLVGAASFSNAGSMYTTLEATNITQTSAQLNGYAQTTVGHGGEAFLWGKTTSYGQSGAGIPQRTNGPSHLDISGLTCGTTYHFKYHGTPRTGGSIVNGQDLTFKTLPCAQPEVENFTGNFAPSNWMRGSNAPINLIDTEDAPTSVTLNSFPEWLISAATFTHDAKTSGTVKFSYKYKYSEETMSSPSECPGSYRINNTVTVFTDGSASQSGTVSFDVNAGENFGFALIGNGSNPGCPANNPSNSGLTPTTLTISEFSFTPK